MSNRINIDEALVIRARRLADEITEEVIDFIKQYTTVSVERAVVRLFGVDGVDDEGIPLPNVVVDNILRAGELGRGAAFWIANAMACYGKSAQEIAESVAHGEIDLTRVPVQREESIEKIIRELSQEAFQKIRFNNKVRREYIERLGLGKEPYLYVIVATGNIYEDVIQAKAAAKQGADIIAVIRTTGQSLLDYVPYGATTEGFGGTYATQENFRIMRKALDEVSEEVGRYIRLTNYSSGLCMPEIAAIAALERLDVLLNDAMYGILFRDINMQRTFVDQFFSRMLISYADIIINTGEDNYLTTADAYEEAHTVIASQFINEQFGLKAGLREEQLGLGHAFEMNPDMEDGLLWEIAQAQLVRELFPNSPIKYMPPTKYMTGNIFRGHIQDGMFNLVSVLTNQTIHLLGILTEAIHTPFMHDRYLSIENARYIMNNARHLYEEISFKPGGRIEIRANEVLKKAVEMLEEIKKIGLMQAISKGMFAQVKRTMTGGKGLEGVVKKKMDYINPFYRTEGEREGSRL